jgi:hypothetical protein
MEHRLFNFPSYFRVFSLVGERVSRFFARRAASENRTLSPVFHWVTGFVAIL